jgi:hypothetical protein
MSNQPNEDKDDDDKSTESRDAEDSSTEKQNDDHEKNRGEAPGNLRRRSDWFQKRHGGG